MKLLDLHWKRPILATYYEEIVGGRKVGMAEMPAGLREQEVVVHSCAA